MANSKTSNKNPKLNIVTPVYNEGKNFPALYSQVKKHIRTPHQLIVVYDFDEDTTIPEVKKIQKRDKDLKLKKNTRGRGVLNALLTGFDYVKSGPILVIMADLSDDLSQVDTMYGHYLDGAAVVCASRYMKGGKVIGDPPLLKRTLSRLAGTSLYYIRRLPTHDVTNAFKLYDKRLLDQIEIESTGGFEIGMEITIKAFLLDKKIVEMPTTWRDRTAGESNFKLWQWLPSYLRWYFYAMFHKRQDKT